MVLRFEVGGLEGEDLGERGRRRVIGKRRVLLEELGKPGCGEGVFGGYVYGWAPQAVGRRELGRKEEGKKELGFAGAAENGRSV